MRLIHSLIAILALCTTSALGQEKAEFATLFAERYPKTLKVLETEFPSDHRLLTIRLNAIDTTGQSQMLSLAAGFNALGDIRRKYAARLLFAPPRELSALLLALAGFYDSVLAADGPGACGLFAQNGSGVLFQLDRSAAYARQLDLQSAAYFEAVVGAIENPEYYGEATPDDLSAVVGMMLAAGVPASYATAIAGGKPADPELCPALAAMFRAAAVLDTPQGLKTRADLARNLAGY